MNDKIYSFSPFGYEGAIVNIETDLRNEIEAMAKVPMLDAIKIFDKLEKVSLNLYLQNHLSDSLQYCQAVLW